jgi:ATP-dependent DNA helicase PIF1
MEGEAITYQSADYVLDERSATAELYTTEFLNSLNLSGLPPHSLTLKKGCIIICLRNLDRHNGLCNGRRLRVTSLNDHTIQATIVSEGAFFGQDCSIPKVPMTPSDTRLPYVFTRFQFPVQLAFGITVNKAQGQSLSRVGIYAPSPLFTHGQLYVMLSRTRNGPEGIFVLSRHINNVVYRDVLNFT